MNIQESFVKKTLNKKTSDIVPTKLELDVQSFISLLSEYTDSLGITNLSKGDIVDTKSESGRELPFIVQKEVKRIVNLDVKSFVVSLVVSPYSYFWGKTMGMPVFDLKFKVLFYPNKNEMRIGIYVNEYKRECWRKIGMPCDFTPRYFFRKSDSRFLDKSLDFFHRPQNFLELTKMGVDSDTLEICKNYIKRIADFKVEPEKGIGVLNLSNDSLEDYVIKVQSIFGNELFCLEEKVLESFTRKIHSKKNDELISKANTAFLPDGVYILHETLGVRGVDGWNPEDNEGVVGILVVEGEHKIVVATEDAPEDLSWSNEDRLINQPVDELGDAESDFNGEYYCRKLNSPDFPAAYYCKTYNKGNRSWYLPSTGELWLICRHLEEIQNALETVGGQKLITRWDEGTPVYRSSTENSNTYAWRLYLTDRYLGWSYKGDIGKVRPVSKFDFSTLKESFTRKIRSKKNDELTTKADTAFIPNGVYILHETLGVRTVDGWNPRNNYGVVGVLVVEDDHKIVVALKDSPKNLCWSKKRGLINQPVDELGDAESDFNGEYYCRKLNSPDFPAAYYCKTYNKGNRSWYLPSTGELWLICRHLEEIQNALETVGGQKLITTWAEGVPVYWSSTEDSAAGAWALYLSDGYLYGWNDKVSDSLKVRPVSKFEPSVLRESFTRKISRKNNDELISKTGVETFIPDGVYILHETLGVRGVDGWKPEDNEGVVGILLIEDDHKIVVATEDAPEDLSWSNEDRLINQPVDELGDAESDFNGEYYCRKLNSPDFPAAYYCKTYNKGNRSWYLPSTGELWMIYSHFDEIQNALSIVGGQKLITTWDEGAPVYWSSTEGSVTDAWYLNLNYGYLSDWGIKVSNSLKVRPVSKFEPSVLRESFTRKISRKNNDELISKADTAFLPDGVYILHKTLGVRTVDGWNPEDNFLSVIGILLVEDAHQIVIALEDAPERLLWSKERKLINEPVKELEDAKSDFNGEYYCRNLNSPKFPAAYYCSNYKKGGRNWHLPSSGELWMIYRHLDEIQNALSIVEGQRFVTLRDKHISLYWSSTEHDGIFAGIGFGKTSDINIIGWGVKIGDRLNVRPVSNFNLSELKESFVKKTRKIGTESIVSDADDKAFNPVMDAKEFVGRMKECILSYKQPYVYGKKNPYSLKDFSFEMITSWPNTFKFNDSFYSKRLLFDVSNSKKPFFRIILNFFSKKDFNSNSQKIICYLTVESHDKVGKNVYVDRMFQYINDSKKKRISFVENPECFRFDDKVESIEPTLSNLNFILNDIRFLMDNWKILYKTYLKKDSFETWNEFYKMLPSQNNKGFDFDLKESFVHKTAKKSSVSLINKNVFGDMESFGEFDMLFKKFLKEHEHQFSSCVMTDYPLKSMISRIGYKISLKKDCPFEDGSNDSTALEFSLDVFQGDILNFENHQDLNIPHGILTVAFYTALGPSRPQQIDLKNLEFGGSDESPDDFYFDKFHERREWEKPNFSYQLLFKLERFLLALVETVNNMDEQTWIEIGITSANFKPFKGEACSGYDANIILNILDNHGFYSELHKNFSKVNLLGLNESFTKKISRKKNDELISKSDTAFEIPDGVYILHDTLGVRTVDGWNPKDNYGAIGILLVEDDHKIVVALEDSPKNLRWSKKRKLVNQPFDESENSDFNGEYYCQNLNSPDFPAAYYCLNYKKGGRSWYLPSSGELMMIYNHLEEIQTALEAVGGQKIVTNGIVFYWSSTEDGPMHAWARGIGNYGWAWKDDDKFKVRPVSKFGPSTLKESFTRKISRKKNNELILKADTAFIPNGVYILHESLGVKTVDSWNTEFNEGVVGILLIEDDHKIVISLEDSPENLRWSKRRKLVNQPIEDIEDAESDFYGEWYCKNQNLNSPEFPAAYYCLNYKKGGRKWYLPSAGELLLIYRHLKEIQTALSIVGGKKFVTEWEDEDVPWYWGSTEYSDSFAWTLEIGDGYLSEFEIKYDHSNKVRPISKFQPSELKESFTKKIKTKGRKEINVQ